MGAEDAIALGIIVTNLLTVQDILGKVRRRLAPLGLNEELVREVEVTMLWAVQAAGWAYGKASGLVEDEEE